MYRIMTVFIYDRDYIIMCHHFDKANNAKSQRAKSCYGSTVILLDLNTIFLAITGDRDFR